MPRRKFCETSCIPQDTSPGGRISCPHNRLMLGWDLWKSRPLARAPLHGTSVSSDFARKSRRRGSACRSETLPMSDSTSSVDVFVVSRNRLLRDVITRLLRNKAGIRSVSAAADFKSLMQQAAGTETRVVVLDPGHATEPVLQEVQKARRTIPSLHVIVIDMEPDL